MGSGGSRTPSSVSSRSQAAAAAAASKTIQAGETRQDYDKRRAYEEYSNVMSQYMDIPERLEDVKGELDFKEGGNKKYVDAEMNDIKDAYGTEALQEAEVRFYRELREKLYGKPESGKGWPWSDQETYTVDPSRFDPENKAWRAIFGDKGEYKMEILFAAKKKWDFSEKYNGRPRRSIVDQGDTLAIVDNKYNRFIAVEPYLSKSSKVTFVFGKTSRSLIPGNSVIHEGDVKYVGVKAPVIKFKTIGHGDID